MSFKDDYIAGSEAKLATLLKPSSSMHLGIDLQGGYCQFPYDPAMLSKEMKAYYDRQDAMLAEITSLAQSFRGAGMQNIWVQQAGTFREEEFANASFYKRGVSREKVIEFAAHAHEICVPVNQRDVVMPKNDFNLFAMAGAAAELRARGANTLILTGGAKDVCLLHSALGAVSERFNTFIIDDLTYLANAYEPEQAISSLVLEACADKGVGVVRSSHVRALLSQP